MADGGCRGTIHLLDYSPSHSDLVLALPVGIAVVPAPQSDLYALAAAYRDAFASGSPRAAAGGDRLIVAAGPLLDSPDEVRIRDLRCMGESIVAEVVHTSARRSGLQLRRNIPFRPLLEIAKAGGSGRYSVEVRWQALESLPDGKPLGAPLIAGPMDLLL